MMSLFGVQPSVFGHSTIQPVFRDITNIATLRKKMLQSIKKDELLKFKYKLVNLRFFCFFDLIWHSRYHILNWKIMGGKSSYLSGVFALGKINLWSHLSFKIAKTNRFPLLLFGIVSSCSA